MTECPRARADEDARCKVAVKLSYSREKRLNHGDQQSARIDDDQLAGARRSRKKMTGAALHYRSVTPFNYLGHKL